MTEARKEQNRLDSKNRRWMKDPKTGESHFVPLEEMQSYFNRGYILGRTLDQSGDKNPIHQHVFTREECEKRSKRLVGAGNGMYKKKLRDIMGEEKYWQWRKNIKDGTSKMRGKWIVNNGYENRWVDPGCIPEGYVRGCLARSKLNPKNHQT